MVSRKRITLIAIFVFIIIGFAGALAGMSYLKSDGYCRYCHSKSDVSNDTLAVKHYAVKTTCFDCHYTGDFADARIKEVLNYTLGYKGAISVEKVDDSNCQKCHQGNISTTVLPHYYVSNCTVCHPAHGKIESGSSKTLLDCYICHATKELGGQHAVIDCVDCHSQYLFDSEKHASLPECSECHPVPHTPEMRTRSDCMLCHPAHSPQQLRSFSQNISKSYCSVCHPKEYNTLNGNNQKHNYFNGSWFNWWIPDWYLDLNNSCAGCHPEHKIARNCGANGCHYYDHMTVHATECEACHKTGYPPKIKCTKCHLDPHAPLPAVGY